MPFLPKVTTVPNLDTFLTAIVNYGVSQGVFTNEGKSGDVFRLSRGGIYWSIRPATWVHSGSTFYGFEARMTYTLPTSATFETVSGQEQVTRISVYTTDGPYTAYYLFNHDNAIHAVLEVYPNVFSHFSFGVMEKVGTWTGGEYITGNGISYIENPFNGIIVYESVRNCFPFDGGLSSFTDSTVFPGAFPGYIRRYVGDDGPDDFARFGQSIRKDQQARGFVVRGMLIEMTNRFGINNFNLRAPIFPSYIRLYDPASTDFWFGGYIPGVGSINGENIQPGTLVDTDRQVFPVVARDAPDPTLYPSSGTDAITYLRA